MSDTFTCFLVDDDIDDQEIFQTVLEGIAPDSNCVVAANGEAALQMLNEGAVSPDIIFLDLNMPLMNGHQFLFHISQLKMYQEIPIIVLTTSADLNTKASVMNSGAKDFVTKPDKFSEWERVLKPVIAKFL
ncbi:MAG TPA: response regulator [Chryseosolibacter sp.]|nr:response regulator [Chryseosolibacter sp.]